MAADADTAIRAAGALAIANAIAAAALGVVFLTHRPSTRSTA